MPILPVPSQHLARLVVLAVVSIVAVARVEAQSAPGSAGAKLASKCQQAISKANGKLLGQRLKQLAACSNAVLGCLQTAPGDAKCLTKASAKCTKQLGAPGAPDPVGDKVETAVVKKCGAVALADLLDDAVLGFANAAARCADLGVQPLATVADVAHCLRLAHAATSEATYGVELPRASELAAQGGVNALRVPGLPVIDGCGECNVGSPTSGKGITSCAAAISKAAAGFIASTRGALDRCSATFVKCAQEKPGDAACLAKAGATCGKVPAGLAKSRAKLQAGIAKKCAGAVLFADLDEPYGLNVSALTCACRQVGVDAVLGLDDYATCVARHHECELASLLPTVVPGLDALLAAQGIAVSDLLCEPAIAANLQARSGRAFTPPFGTISKYMKGVFPGALTQTKSPVATRGTPPRVGAPTSSRCTPAPGKSCTFTLPISKRPFGFKSGERGGAPDPAKLIIAVRRLDGEFVDDHYELPLADTTNDSEVELEVAYADDLESCEFELALSVAEDGAVSSYTALEQVPHLPPVNDRCSAATAIDPNPFFQIVDTTAAGFLDDEPTPSCAGAGVVRGVWYGFTPATNGQLILTTAGSDFRAAIALYAGGCDGAEVACEASLPGDQLTPATVQFPVTGGTPYRVHVATLDGFQAATSTLSFTAAFVPLSLGQSPATISNLILGTPVVNDPTCALVSGQSSTSFPMTVTFADSSGQTVSGQVAMLALEHFEPSQREEYGVPSVPYDVTGDGFSGTVHFDACAHFGTDTLVSFKVNLATVGGLSNQLVGALPKPPGAD